MALFWILVANSIEAKIFESDVGGKDLRLLREFNHPEGRKKERELLADKPGRSYESGSSGRHTMDPATTGHEQEQIIFSKQLMEYLEKEFQHKKFERCAMVAPPAFLGKLRENASTTFKKGIREEVNKDLLAKGIAVQKLESELKTTLKLQGLG